MLVGLAVVENIVGPATKYLLTRPRPHWLHPIAVEHSTSYPSGHATAAGMFATALVLTALTCIRPGPRRIVALGVVALIIGVVAADRILLAVHSLSDVVGGVLLGAALALACWWLKLAWARRTTPRVVEGTGSHVRPWACLLCNIPRRLSRAQAIFAESIAHVPPSAATASAPSLADSASR
jgi:membrane-associated phospholipid phosphatase